MSTKKQLSSNKKQTSIQDSSQSIVVKENKKASYEQIKTLFKIFNNRINQSTHINNHLCCLNLIKYHRDHQYNHDPQMITARLRKIQNTVEIDRAQREIQIRQRKRMRKLCQYRKHRSAVSNYRTIYQQFIAEQRQQFQLDQISDDQDKQNKGKTPVAYFSKLKKHPLLLQYTVNKIKSKEKVIPSQAEKLKRAFATCTTKFSDKTEEYESIYNSLTKRQFYKTQHNPESIFKTRTNRMYSKKYKQQQLSHQIKSIPICQRLMKKQNQIVSQINQQHLSEQGKHQLKNKLNSIVFTLSQTQKFRKLSLPKLSKIVKTVNLEENKLKKNIQPFYLEENKLSKIVKPFNLEDNNSNL